MELIEAFPRLISWAIPLIVLVIIILPQAIRILREYERGVIFRLGKLLGAKGPGLIFLIPIVDRMVRMDLRVVTINVERCKGCGFCVEFCPTKVLSLSSAFNSKGYHAPYVVLAEKCSGCDLCGMYCPDFAIVGARLPA